MKNKNKLLLSLLASLAVASTGHAQKKDAPELSPLNVVGSNADAPKLSSGLKSSLSLNEAPESGSIMGSDQIKAQGLKSIGDVLDYTPGVINSQGEGHRDAPIIRGMRTTQDLYRDGVRDDVQYYRPLYNVESVEVLRGPNALRSGFGGAYGIVNRVTKSGVIGEDFTVLSGSLDSFGETNVQLDKNMQLDDKTALRVNIFGENLSNHRDFYYGHGFGVNPTLFYELGDGSTLDISYEYLDQERFIDRGIPSENNKPKESYKDIVFGDATENFSTHEAHIMRAIYEHELSDSLTGRLSVHHSNHDKLYQNFYASAYASDGNVTLDGYVDTTKRKTSTFSYEVSGEFETGSVVHSVIAGFEYLDVQNDNDRYHANWLPDDNSDSDTALFKISELSGLSGGSGKNAYGNYVTNYYDGNKSVLADRTFADVKITSFYLVDEISLTDSLDLVLGARFDNMDFDVIGGGPLSDSEDTISPRIGLIFDATDELSLYASYSETFAPKAKDQYAKLKDDADKMDPDTFQNTEFGLKYDFPMGLELSAAYFEVEANTPGDFNATTFYSRMIKSKITGFEVQLQGSITEKWYVSAAFTNLDAHADDGDRLKETPENVYSIWNNYLVSDRLAVNLGIIHQDESHISEGSAFMLPEYTRVDAGASYLLTENTSVQLNVENLTDELYFPHAHGTHQASVGAPINAMLSITSSF